MADTNVAIKLYKTSATSKRVGINVTNSIDTTGYALYVNGATNITGSLTLGTALPIASGGTGKTTAAAAWTALGGGASGKHPDNYFALASHTHSYAGSSSAGGAATSANVLNVIDERSAAMTIDKAKKIEAFFSNNGMPNSNWWAGIHVTGWQGAYSSWELVGPAHNTDQRTQPLYIRSSNTNSAWGSWRQVYDSSNPPTAAAVGAAASSHTHTYANITDAGTHVYDATISRTKNTVLAAPNGSNGTASFRALVLADLPTGTTSSTVAIGNHTHNVLQLYEARATTTNLNKAANYGGAGAMFHLVATSATTTGKPPTDSTILQMNWDNNGGYDSQFGISTDNNRAFYRSRPSEGTTWSEIAHITAGTAVGGVKGPTYVSSTGVVTACNTLTALATNKEYGFADFTLTNAVTSYNYLLMIGKVTSSAPIISTVIPMAKITTIEQLFQIADYGNNYRSVGIKKNGNNIVISSANGHAQSGSTIDIYGGL